MSNADFLARAPELRAWSLRVAEATDASPRTRHLRLTSPDLADLTYAPGQDLMVTVDTSGGRVIRRRYTIRSFDRAARALDLVVIAHTDGPGARWVRALRVGDTVEALGPRGKITLAPGVAWHLFIGDDVAAPAMAAMAEALPPGARALALIEVAGPAEELAVSAPGVDLTWQWLHRGDRPADDPAGLLAAIAALELPDGRGHAYVAGEAGVVAALRAALAERGLAPEQISPKAYWGRGRANASHGEPFSADRGR
jgi:NADPH-dependent ferric siderophore reductase